MSEAVPLLPLTLENCRNLRWGFTRITLDEFAEVLRSSIGASRDYAETKWSEFQRDYIAYCASRAPAIQGEKLFELAVSKMDK
jgi:hypothetical protein